MMNFEIALKWSLSVAGAVAGLIGGVASSVADGTGEGEIDLSKLPAPAEREVDFVRDIQPIFQASCVECHGPDKQKSDFRLDVKAMAMEGGSIGQSIISGNSAESPIIHYVADLVEDMRMPPKGDALSAESIGLLRAWIDQGAQWPESASVELADPLDWWSLRPLKKQEPPQLSFDEALWVRTPVDAFIVRRLRESGLSPSPEADRRTLIRRVYFDITGLPPTPEEVDAFVADPDCNAYEKLVDQLLDSPHYGERWARHWLDVVHYGDSHGYDKDKQRPNAWPYRDYVIRSFNEDKPYSRFVKEQIAGDEFYPYSADGILGTGFIATGPWDFIAHAEVPETKIDGKIGRHLDRDDMVATTMNTFVSATVQCAQCHQHKFDPVSQEDYYSLQAVFAALDRADRPYDTDPQVAQLRERLEAQKKELSEQIDGFKSRILEAGGEELAGLNQRIEDAQKENGAGSRPESGYHSAIATQPDVVKWVQVDLGEPKSLARLVMAGCYDDFAGIGAGFGFPVRFKIETSNDADFECNVQMVANHLESDFKNPGTVPVEFEAPTEAFQYIRITATQLAHRQNDYIFALAELQAFDSEGNNLTFNANVTSLDSIEAPVRWQRKNLVDDYYPGKKLQAEDLDALKLARETLINKVVAPAVLQELAESESGLESVQFSLEELPKQQYVYAGTVHHGSGTFRGTGPDGGKPREIRILNRGNILSPGKVVEPRAIDALPYLRKWFDLPEEHSEGIRRVALANWITDKNNPLTWRSIVNRVWQYHFGSAIVDTPNDFGRMGKLPTHPQLLDWMAKEFRDNGQSIKDLHRLILNSSTYRQSSASNTVGAERDSTNQLLWRMNRKRLEAEAIRDSALVVSGKLDPKMYGPAFQNFIIDKPEHSPHYEYHLHDPTDPATHRRTIYRFLVRSQPQPFMSALDCADPSMAVAKRDETLTSLQALALMNNKFMVAMADYFADRVRGERDGLQDQVRRAFQLALIREPIEEELTQLTEYAKEYGMENVCRVLLNLNEFIYID
jgi:mono/diheme cytochrome c family protein